MTFTRPGLWLTLLLVVTAGVFSPALHAEFTSDDKMLIEDNTRLRGDGAWERALADGFWATEPPSVLAPMYWRPVVKLSHVAMWKLGDGNPFPFHALSLLLHLACVALSYLWLRRRLVLHGMNEATAAAAALAGAALFALHTTRFENVPWVCGATDVWMTLFVLASAVVVRTRWWLLTMPFAALAFMSKEGALVYPLVLTLDGFFAPSQRLPRVRVIATWLGVLAPLPLRMAFGHQLPSQPDAATFVERAERVLAAFAGNHVRLLPLTPTLNPFDINRVQQGVWLVPGWLVALGVALALLWLVALLRWRQTRSALADALWWLVPLLPVLQLKNVPSVTLISDRFQYLPLLGVCALLASAIPPLVAVERRRRPVALLLTGLLGTCALQLWLAVPAFENNLMLTGREFELHPDSGIAASGYATELKNAGHWQAALRVARHAAGLPQAPLEHDLAVIDVAALECLVASDADRDALRALMAFVDGVLNPRQTPTEFSLRGETWPLTFRHNLRENARIMRRGGDLPLVATGLRLRLGLLDEALEASKENLRVPSPHRRLLMAQVLAVRGDWGAARAEARQLALDEPDFKSSAMNVLSQIDDLSLRVPYDVEWSTIRRAAALTAINTFSAARRELQTLGPSRDVLLAQVQVEVYDRNFDGALALLDAALLETPGDPELTHGREDVLKARLAYAETVREELDRWAPSLVEPTP